MKQITIQLKDQKHAQLKEAIMIYVAKSNKVRLQVFESTVLKGFIFEVRRNKTIKCIER